MASNKWIMAIAMGLIFSLLKVTSVQQVHMLFKPDPIMLLKLTISILTNVQNSCLLCWNDAQFFTYLKCKLIRCHIQHRPSVL